MASTEDLLGRLNDFVDILIKINGGQSGFKEVTNGSTLTDDNIYFALKAVNGDVTLGAGTTTVKGDSPTSGDVILQGNTVYGHFDDIEVDTATNGKLYVYYID